MDYMARGRVRPGNYRHLWLDGECEIDGDVTFETCTVSGVVTMAACAGGRLVCRAGLVVCRGDMRVATVEGHGGLLAGGGLDCDRFEFTGEALVAGTLDCARTLSVRGRLVSRRAVRADSIELEGILDGRDVHARSLMVKPLRGMMLERHRIGGRPSGSRARTIVGTTVTVAGMECETLHARTASLSEHCRVARLCSRGGYASDGTSHVARYDADCDGGHVAPSVR